MKDANGDLEFKGIKKDQNFIDLSERRKYGYGSVYNQLAHGDSGGPIIRKVIDVSNGAQEKRNVIVAIISIGATAERRDTKCLNGGTKLIQELIQWIKKLDSGDFSLGKKINKPYNSSSE